MESIEFSCSRKTSMIVLFPLFISCAILPNIVKNVPTIILVISILSFLLMFSVFITSYFYEKKLSENNNDTIRLTKDYFTKLGKSVSWDNIKSIEILEQKAFGFKQTPVIKIELLDFSKYINQYTRLEKFWFCSSFKYIIVSPLYMKDHSLSEIKNALDTFWNEYK